MVKPLEQALTERVRETLGAQQLQILQLQVQVEMLAAENAELKAVTLKASELYQALRDAVAALGGIHSANVPLTVLDAIAAGPEGAT